MHIPVAFDNLLWKIWFGCEREDGVVGICKFCSYIAGYHAVIIDPAIWYGAVRGIDYSENSRVITENRSAHIFDTIIWHVLME